MLEADPKEWVFVGLGNPGKKYEGTRHNIGYMVIRALAKKLGWHLKEEARYPGWVAKGKVQENRLHLLMPTCYMNNSGQALKKYLDFYRLGPANIAVVVDDLALSFGEVRLRVMGSSGGHNGLTSVEKSLGTRHYIRLRMGIGMPIRRSVNEITLADYVLADFTQEEQQGLKIFIEKGEQVLERLLSEEISKVMSSVNTKASKKVLGEQE